MINNADPNIFRAKYTARQLKAEALVNQASSEHASLEEIVRTIAPRLCPKQLHNLIRLFVDIEHSKRRET